MTILDERPTQRRVTPTGWLVLPSAATRPEWLAVRKTGLGSSDMPGTMGVSNYSSPLHVFYEKTGRLPDNDDAGEAALWGTLHEETVAREWARRNRSVMRRVGLVAHVDESWQMCTLDRRVVECPLGNAPQGCALEIKTRSAWLAGKWKKGVPDDVLAQVIWQIIVTGFDHIHVAVLIGGNDYRQFVVRRADHLVLIKDVLTVASDLWHNHIVIGRTPDTTGFEPPDAMLSLYDRLHPTREGVVRLDRQYSVHDDLAAYVQASKAKSAAEKAQKAAKAMLMGHLGGAQVAVLNDKLAFSIEWTAKASIDADRLRERHPEAYEDCLKNGGHDRIQMPAAIRKEYSE